MNNENINNSYSQLMRETSMKAQNITYFQKRYCLLVHSLTLKRNISITSLSQSTADQDNLQREYKIPFNHLNYVTCIDKIDHQAAITASSQVLIKFSAHNQKGYKENIACVKFDMLKQKVVKPESTIIFTRQLEDHLGSIEYKFISLKTRKITEEELKIQETRHDEISIQLNQQENYNGILSQKMKEFQFFLEKKNQLISSLEQKIKKLMNETIRANSQVKQLQKNRSSKEKNISLNVQVNTREQFRVNYEKMKNEVISWRQKCQNLEGLVQKLSKQKEHLNLEASLYQKQLQKSEEIRVRDRKKTVMQIRNDLELKGSYLHVPEQAHFSTFNHTPSKKNLEETMNALENLKESQINRNLQSIQLQIPEENKNANLKQSGVRERSKSRKISIRMADTPQLTPKAADMQKSQINQLMERINNKKEDLKWANAVQERQEEIQMLRKKLLLKEEEINYFEHQIQNLRNIIKKKDLEIKDSKKHISSIKNLNKMEGLTSPRSDGLEKKRSFNEDMLNKKIKIDTDLEIEKIVEDQNEDNEKIAGLEDQIQKLQISNSNLNKELKRKALKYEEIKMQSENYEKKNIQFKKNQKNLEMQLIQSNQKALLYEKTIKKNEQLQKLYNETKEKLNSLELQKTEMNNFNQKIKARLLIRDQQWQKIKSIETNYQISKRKCNIFEKTVEQFESKYNQIKKYCTKVEAAYNKFINFNKRKSQNSSHEEDNKNFQKEEKQMKQKLVEFAKKIKEVEVDYFKQNIEDLNEQKKYITLLFEKITKEQIHKIEGDSKLKVEDKKYKIQSKQKQLNEIMLIKQEQLDHKIAAAIKYYEQFLQNNQQLKQSLSLTLQEKIRLIEKKIKNLSDKYHEKSLERKSLYQSIHQLSDQIKKSKDLYSINDQRTEAKKLTNLSQIQENRYSEQRKSLIQEMSKNREIFQKSYEEMKKNNITLLKQRSQFELQCQKLKMNEEKMIFKHQQRERNLERKAKEIELEFKANNERLSFDLQRASEERAKIRQENERLHESISELEEQIKLHSQALANKEQQAMELEEIKAKLQKRLNQYELAERMLIQEVHAIKEHAKFNQNQFQILMDQRNDKFITIQKIKELQIHKLKEAMCQIELKLEAEVYENLKIREKNQEAATQIEQSSRRYDSTLEELSLVKNNQQQEIDSLFVKQYHFEKENEILKQNLIEISGLIEEKEIEITNLKVQNLSLSKQICVYQRESEEIRGIEATLREDLIKKQNLILDRNNYIKGFQTQYVDLSNQIKSISLENKAMKEANLALDIQNQKILSKIEEKDDTILKLKEEKMLIEVELKKNGIIIQENFKKISQIQIIKNTKEEEIQKLKQMIEDIVKKNIEAQSPRKSSRDRVALEPSSPTKRAKMQKPQSLFNSIEELNKSAITMQPLRIIQQDQYVRTPQPERSSPKKAEYNTSNPFEPKFNKPQNMLSNEDNVSKISSEFGGKEMMPMHLLTMNKEPSAISKVNVQIEENEVEHQSEYDDKRSKININVNIPLLKPGQSFEEQSVKSQIAINNHQNLFPSFDNRSAANSIHSIQKEKQSNLNELQEELELKEQQLQECRKFIQDLERENAKLREMLDHYEGQSVINVKSEHSKEKSDLHLNLNFKLQNSKSDEQLEHQSQLQKLPKSHRSQSGHNLNSNRHDSKLAYETNEKMKEDQLYISQLENKINQMQKQMQSHFEANNKLQQLIEEYKVTLIQMENKIEEEIFEKNMYKKYQEFESLYLKEVEARHKLEYKIQELILQNMDKDSRIGQLIQSNCQLQEKLGQIQSNHMNFVQKSEMKLNKIPQLENKLVSFKKQYRKYEENAQLQILHLKEDMQALNLKISKKQEEILMIGEECLEKNAYCYQLEAKINQFEKSSKSHSKNISELEGHIQNLQIQLNKKQQNRKKLFDTIKKLEAESFSKSEDLSEVNRNHILFIQKSDIKEKYLKEEANKLNQKIVEKEAIIQMLKVEIGHYNNECQQFKKINEALETENIKIQRELKNIMSEYEKQFNQKLLECQIQNDQVLQMKKLCFQKEDQNIRISKEFSSLKYDYQKIKEEFVDLQQNFTHFKSQKCLENQGLMEKIVKKDHDFEKLRYKFEKQNQDSSKTLQQKQEKQKKMEDVLQNYKEKLKKYENMIQILENEYKNELANRPASHIYEQVLFENEVFKNRIQQLQNLVNCHKEQTDEKGEMIYLEYQKYKSHKERQVYDLQNEMEKYASKINELEESNYMLKKEVESIRCSQQKLTVQNHDLEDEISDLKYEMKELEEENKFYKKRNLSEINKLLNQTKNY